MHPIQAHNLVLFSIIHRVVYASPHSIFEHCHRLQRNPIPISNHLPPRILPPSKPWKRLIYFPFFWPCQFGTFNIGEIILYVVRGINFFLFLTINLLTNVVPHNCQSNFPVCVCSLSNCSQSYLLILFLPQSKLQHITSDPNILQYLPLISITITINSWMLSPNQHWQNPQFYPMTLSK